jgi:type II secretory pathway component PulC
MRFAAITGEVLGRYLSSPTVLAIVSLLGLSFARSASADASSPPRLAGTIISDDAHVAVLVGDKAEGSRAVHEGEEFLGWRVERIDRERVVLSRSGRAYQVPLMGDPTAIAVTSIIPPPRQDTDNEETTGAPPPGSPVDPRRSPHGLR